MIRQPNKMVQILAMKLHRVEEVDSEENAKQAIFDQLQHRKVMSGLVILVNETPDGIVVLAGEQGALSSEYCEDDMDGVNHGFLGKVTSRDCSCGIQQDHSHCFCGKVLNIEHDPLQSRKPRLYGILMWLSRYFGRLAYNGKNISR